MRSTQKEIARLYREVREAIGVKTNKEAGEHIAKASLYYVRKLNQNGVTAVFVTCHKDNTWGIYGLKNQDETFLPLSTESLLDTPSDNVKRFVDIAS